MKCAYIFRPVGLIILLLLVVTCVGAYAQKPPARKRTAVAPGRPLGRRLGSRLSSSPSVIPATFNFSTSSCKPERRLGGGGKGRAGGVALYTSDGGDHWTINLGDPQSNAAAFSHLRFIDPRHGWMVQGNDQLLRTVDGQNWEVVARFPTTTSITSSPLRLLA